MMFFAYFYKKIEMKLLPILMIFAQFARAQSDSLNNEAIHAETITFCRFADGQAILRDIDTLQYLQLRNQTYKLIIRQRDIYGQITAARIISDLPNQPKNLLVINQHTLVLYFKNGDTKNYQRCEP